MKNTTCFALFCSVVPHHWPKKFLLLVFCSALWSLTNHLKSPLFVVVVICSIQWCLVIMNLQKDPSCLCSVLYFATLSAFESVWFFFHFSFVCCCILAAVAQLLFHTYWSLNINYIEICAHSRSLGVAEGSFTVKPSLPGIYHLFFCDTHQEHLYSSSVFNLSCEGITRTLRMTAI